MVKRRPLEALTVEQLVFAFLDEVKRRGWRGVDVERLVPHITAHDYSTWKKKRETRSPIVRIDAAKEAAVLDFLRACAAQRRARTVAHYTGGKAA